MRRGQIAIGFLAVMGIALVLVMMTVNVGQMAKVRVEVSNAADAGAMAGASWIASGMNEAGLVVAKIDDAILMVQAIYLVPFCPGLEQSRYARTLWQSLVEHPYLPDPMLAGPGYRRRGPVPYFHEVANDAMWAAWYVGGREWYTAAVNNLMINGAVGLGTVDGMLYTNYADLAPRIANNQRGLIHSGVGGPPAPLTWNNSLEVEDEMNLTHTAPMTIEYPEAPPQMVLDPLTQTRFGTPEYRQFLPARSISVPGVPDEFFDCTFEGWGIRTGYDGTSSDPDALFVLMPGRNPSEGPPVSFLDYGINPLIMAGGTVDFDGDGVGELGKLWDVSWRKSRPLGSNDDERLDNLNVTSPLNPYIPSIEHIRVLGEEHPSEFGGLGPCKTPAGDDQYVCGVVPKPLPVLAMKPRFVNGPSNHVTVAVAHKVETAAGWDHFDFGITLPHLVPRFDPVAAKARATFFPPTLPLLGPDDEAKSVLDEAR